MFTHVMPRDGHPACEGELDLVDAAFERPGGPEGRLLTERFCPRCPVAAECLVLAMNSGEHGTWGGTIRKTRSEGRRPGLWRNLNGIEHGRDRRSDRRARKAAA